MFPPAPPWQVLLVDDDPAIRDLVQPVLRSLGCEMVWAADGASGLAALDASQPHLVLLDILMPGMDGLEMLRRMRSSARHREVRVIVLSQRGDVASRVAGLDLGATDYLPKPFDIGELTARVRRALREETELRAKVGRERRAALGELAVAVCHELNNPLTTLLGELQLLARIERSPEAIDRALASVEKCAIRMRDVLARVADARDETTTYVGDTRMTKL